MENNTEFRHFKLTKKIFTKKKKKTSNNKKIIQKFVSPIFLYCNAIEKKRRTHTHTSKDLL